MRTWRTDELGRVHVTDNDGPEWLPYPGSAALATADHVIARWGDLLRAEADGAGIPWAWLVAMCARESGGNPRARNPEGTADPGNDGIGLFQITHPSLKGGHSDEQLMDPQLNTRIAARYCAELATRFGRDFPRVSASFNAGSPRPDPASPWNLHATGDHITYEVEVLNYTLTRGLPMVEAPPLDLGDAPGQHAGGDDEPEPDPAA